MSLTDGRAARRRPTWIALLLVGLGGCAYDPASVEGPNWDGAGLGVTPAAATMEGVDGWALLRCPVDEAMRLQSCAVIGESPSGWGFAEAALKMVPNLQIREGSAQDGYKLPQPGEIALLPVIFCQREKVVCGTRLRAAASAFSVEAKRVGKLLDAGRCEEAIAEARRTGQARFPTVVQADCARGR